MLTEGPWIIQDHYLTVRKWNPDFVPFLATVESTLAWVRFPSPSMVYYDDNMLRVMLGVLAHLSRLALTQF